MAEPHAPPAPQAPPAARGAGGYLLAVYAIALVELNRMRREPSVVLTRTAQPLLWLLVFGAAMSRVRGLVPAGVDYQAYIVPGLIAQVVLLIALSSGLSVIWDRDLGITQRVVVAPVARSAIVVGKAAGAALRALVPVLLLLVLAAAAGIPLRWSVAGLLGVSAATVLGAVFFSSIAMVVASLVRSREHFMGLGQLIVLPALFASNALYPVSLMPGWLQAVALGNPLTYQVDLLRHLLLDAGEASPVASVGLLVAGTAVAVAVAAGTYPRRVM